jgi:hypothetical protein
MMRFAGDPASAFATDADQMTGRMQAGIQKAPRRIDSGLGFPGLHCGVDHMHHVLDIMENLDHFAVPNPACVAGLPATLWMKRGATQHHRKSIVTRGAAEHIDLRGESIFGKKQAWGHGEVPEKRVFKV